MIIFLSFLLLILLIVLWWPFKLIVEHNFPPRQSRVELGFMRKKWQFYNSFKAKQDPEEPSLTKESAVGNEKDAAATQTVTPEPAASSYSESSHSSDYESYDLRSSKSASKIQPKTATETEEQIKTESKLESGVESKPELEHYSYDDFFASESVEKDAVPESKEKFWSKRAVFAAFLAPSSAQRSKKTFKSLVKRFVNIFNVDFRKLNLNAPLHNPAYFGVIFPLWESLKHKYAFTKNWNLYTDWQSDEIFEDLEIYMVVKWRIITVFWYLLRSIFNLLVLALIVLRKHKYYKNEVHISQLSRWKIALINHFFSLKDA
ncbi:MAG: hypothetical protein GX801_07585 [Fibrobacter sp.]|nr:hypothetical protein [Fibrobacter sp.]